MGRNSAPSARRIGRGVSLHIARAARRLGTAPLPAFPRAAGRHRPCAEPRSSRLACSMQSNSPSGCAISSRAIFRMPDRCLAALLRGDAGIFPGFDQRPIERRKQKQARAANALKMFLDFREIVEVIECGLLDFNGPMRLRSQISRSPSSVRFSSTYRM